MRTFVAAMVMSFVVALLCVPLAARLARWLGAVSVPGKRDSHSQPIPRLGGLAIALAAIAPILALFVVDSSVARWVREDSSRSLALVLGGLTLAAVGAWDDTRPIRARYKLVVQVLAAIFAYGMGFRIDGVTIPGVGPVDTGLLSLPLTLAWIVGVTNAVNFIDGLDGLAAGVVLCAATANFVVALLNGSVFVALVMSCLAGALLGFLRYNFNPARIFMGDSGSYFLGYCLACTSLAGAAQKASTTVALLVPILALGVPIFDTLVSMARRNLEGRSMFAPDRGHIHHRLLDRGLSQRRVVLTLYGVSAVLALCAIMVSFGRAEQVGLAIVLAAGLIFGLIAFARTFSLAHFKVTPGHERLCDLGQALRERLLTLPIELHDAKDEGEVRRVLERLAADLGLLALDLTPLDPERQAFAWQDEKALEDSGSAHRDEVRARVEASAQGTPQARLEFRWRDSAEAVNLQTQVLLQLTADHVGCALARLEPSAEAPGPDTTNTGTDEVQVLKV